MMSLASAPRVMALRRWEGAAQRVTAAVAAGMLLAGLGAAASLPRPLRAPAVAAAFRADIPPPPATVGPAPAPPGVPGPSSTSSPPVSAARAPLAPTRPAARPAGPSTAGREAAPRGGASSARAAQPDATRLRRATLAYRGLGTWASVYEWTAAYTGGHPAFGLADIDAMATQGVQALYIQVGHDDAPTDIVEPDRLAPLIARAHARGLRVVAWYVPMLDDPAKDVARMLSAARFPGVDSLAVDIEVRDIADPVERSRRVVDESLALRRALPELPLGAIVFPPTVMEVINPSFWPGFPWAGIAHVYDVWLPMAYWSDRSDASGYRDAFHYTVDNVARVRHDLGRPDALVHPIGGTGDGSVANDYAGFVRASHALGVVGASVYTWRLTDASAWTVLRQLRAKP